MLWKVQGQNIHGKLVATLGKSEMSSGLSYVVFSRVRLFLDIAIDGGLTWDPQEKIWLRRVLKAGISPIVC